MDNIICNNNYNLSNSHFRYKKQTNNFKHVARLENDLYEKKNVYCKNCGKYGHPYKKCKEPIASYGIICFRLLDTDTNKLISYDEILSQNIKIEFLLIQRKHTLGYMEFIRGKYFISDVYSIMILFKQMVQEEIDLIACNNFDYHWDMLWQYKCNKSSIYRTEYENSKRKYNYLKNNTDSNINLRYIICNISPKFSNKEWGMPKGRRNNYESNIQSAVREFQEETSYNNKEYKIMTNFDEYTEIFNGTNGIKYLHTYFIANCLTNRTPNLKNEFKSNEIGNIKWFTFEETCKKLRSYHTEKIRIITEINKLLIERVNNVSKKIDN